MRAVASPMALVASHSAPRVHGVQAVELARTPVLVAAGAMLTLHTEVADGTAPGEGA